MALTPFLGCYNSQHTTGVNNFTLPVLYTLHKHDFHIIFSARRKKHNVRWLDCMQVPNDHVLQFQVSQGDGGIWSAQVLIQIIMIALLCKPCFFRCFFMVIFYDHAVVVIDGVCVQKLKILFNAGTSQSVLSTPKDLLQICTGHNNIYHNSLVYGI